MVAGDEFAYPVGRVKHHDVHDGEPRDERLAELRVFHRPGTDEAQLDALGGEILRCVELRAADRVHVCRRAHRRTKSQHLILVAELMVYAHGRGDPDLRPDV